ncbi:MAG: glycosyltransferase family 4 protein [bacterium]
MFSMRILQVITCQTWVGEAENALYLIKKLVERGHKVSVACKKGGAVDERLNGIGVQKVIYLKPDGFELWVDLKDIWKMRNLLKKEEFDILHAHRGTGHWNVAVAARLTKKNPIIIRTRHVHTPVKNHIFNKWLYEKATDKVITVAEMVRQRLLINNRLDPTKIVTIYGAVDCDRFNPQVNGKKIRDELELDDLPVVGTIGHLDPVKGYEYFIQAASIVKKKKPEVKFLIVGQEGIVKKDELHALATKLGIAEDILLPGFRSDIPEIMSALNIGVISSVDSEANSRVTLELMATGKPVVATKVGCIPEIVKDGKTGLLCSPGDAEGLSNAILTLLDDKKKAWEMGLAGRQIVEKSFTEDIFVEKVENLYIELMQEKKILRR